MMFVDLSTRFFGAELLETLGPSSEDGQWRNPLLVDRMVDHESCCRP